MSLLGIPSGPTLITDMQQLHSQGSCFVKVKSYVTFVYSDLDSHDGLSVLSAKNCFLPNLPNLPIQQTSKGP